MTLLLAIALGVLQDARALVEKLRSEKPEEREEATRTLRDLGEAAKGELERVVGDADKEVSARAKALLHELTPEGTLERIERELVEAKTARIVYKSVVQMRGETRRTWGTLLLAQGNRARLRTNGVGGMSMDHDASCDGERMRRHAFQEGWKAPPNVQRVYAAGVARLDTMTTTIFVWGMLDAGDLIEAFYRNAETAMKIVDAKFGPVEEGAPTIAYRIAWRLKPEDEVEHFDVKIAIDRRRCSVLRRTCRVGKHEVVETFREWARNVEIDDDEFMSVDDRIKRHGDAIAGDPKNAAAFRRRGAALLERIPTTEDAARDFTRAIELDPRDAEAFRLRAIARTRMKEPHKALEDARRALELAPRHAPTLRTLSEMARRTGDVEEELAALDRLVEIEPDNIVHFVNRGLTRTLRGETEKALADFARAEKLDPDVPQVYSNRALALARAGRHKEAIEQAEKALAIDKYRPYYAYAARGLARETLGDEEGARADFKEFEELGDNDPLRKHIAEWRKEK